MMMMVIYAMDFIIYMVETTQYTFSISASPYTLQSTFHSCWVESK